MNKADDTLKFKEKLKSKNLCGLYLFTGEEKYNRDASVNAVKKQFTEEGFEEFNILTAEDNSVNIYDLRGFIESFPVMAEHKLLIVKNSSIFKQTNEETRTFWQDIFENLPDYMAIVFDEDNTDGRSALLKKIKTAGIFIDFKYFTPAQLTNWAIKKFAAAGFNVTPDTASHLVFSCDDGMYNLENEINKLISYCSAKQTVTDGDIDKVVRKSLQSRVFAMTDAITAKRPSQAYQMLNELKVYKESPIMIIALLGRQIAMLLKTSALLESGRHDSVASALGVKPFIARKYTDIARGSSSTALSRALKLCLDADYMIKSGRMEEWAAVETLMAKIMDK